MKLQLEISIIKTNHTILAMLNEDNIIKDNIKEFRLLTEWVNRNDIIDAIQKHDVIYIYYAGDETVNRGYRTIEPYALGVSTAGNLVLRAWEQAGASDSKDHEPKSQPTSQYGWRLFRLDGITSWLNTMKKFATDKSKIRPKYNPNDKGMTEIIAAVNPDDLEIKISGLGSVDKSDKLKQKLSAFDSQADKFKNFYDAAKNKDIITKKTIGDLYNYIKLQQKKDPMKYIVVNRNGRIWFDRADKEGNYNSDDVLGNLNSLYRKLYDIKGFKIDKNFIDKKRREFINAIKNTSQK